MKKSLSEKMFEKIEKMQRMIFPPAIQQALRQAEFEQKILPKEQEIKSDITNEDILNSLSTNVETLEEIKSIKEITIQNKKDNKQNFWITIIVTAVLTATGIIVSIFLSNKPIKIDDNQINELKPLNIQENQLPTNIKSNSYTSIIITRKRTMTHHKNKYEGK